MQLYTGRLFIIIYFPILYEIIEFNGRNTKRIRLFKTGKYALLVEYPSYSTSYYIYRSLKVDLTSKIPLELRRKALPCRQYGLLSASLDIRTDYCVSRGPDNFVLGTEQPNSH